MGKVTIIVQHPSMSSTELAEAINYNLSYGLESLMELEDGSIKPDVFVVPNDEEYPDLG